MIPFDKLFIKDYVDDPSLTPISRAVQKSEQCCSGANVPEEMIELRLLIHELQEKIKMERNENILYVKKLEEQLQINVIHDLEDCIKEYKAVLVDINNKYLELENEFNQYISERNKLDMQIVDNITGLTDIIESNVKKITTNLSRFISANNNKSKPERSENESNFFIFETAACLTKTIENMKAYCNGIKDVCSCFINDSIRYNKEGRFKVIEAIYSLNNFNSNEMNNTMDEIGRGSVGLIEEHESLNQTTETDQATLNNKDQQDYIKELNMRINVLEDTGYKLNTALRCTEMEKLSLSLRVTELEDTIKKFEFTYLYKENEVINLTTKLENSSATIENQRKTIDSIYKLLNNQQGRLEDTCKLSLSLSQAEEKILQLEEELLKEKLRKEIKNDEEINNEDMILIKTVEEKSNEQVLANSDLKIYKEQYKQMRTNLQEKTNEEMKDTPDDNKFEDDLLTKNLR